MAQMSRGSGLDGQLHQTAKKSVKKLKRRSRQCRGIFDASFIWYKHCTNRRYTYNIIIRKGICMIEFLSNNWQLLTTLAGVTACLYKQVIATRKGVRALLRADLIRLYNKYHDDLGYCPVYVKQSLEDEYQQYHALHGNGVGTQLYNALMALPTEPQEGE